MNTFIKRSMMLGLSLIFIGAAVVPACAQNKKGIIKGAKAALGKKPPMTGTAPVVKPVPPRVPPTLQGVQVPTRFAVPNEALNAAVERETETQLTHLPVPNKIALPHSIQATDISIKELKKFYESHNISFYGIRDSKVSKVVHAFEITDALFFKEHGVVNESVARDWNYKDVWQIVVQEVAFGNNKYDGQIANELFRNWERPITQKEKVQRLLDWFSRASEHFTKFNVLSTADSPLQPLFELRQNQIRLLLKTNKTQADVTTQRTAEEIKSLVENLPEDNELRQAIEGTLKDNGYIAPAE